VRSAAPSATPRGIDHGCISASRHRDPICADVLQPGARGDRRLRRFGDTRTYGAGERLLEAGEVSPGMFVIPTGDVTVTQHNALGRDQPIVTHPPGSFMAELAQLSGRPSLVDAHAIRPVERGRPGAARAPRAAQGGEAAAALACAPPAALLLDHRRLPRPVGGAPGVPPRVREGGEEGGPHARPGRRRWAPPPRCALHPPTASATPTRPSTSRRGRTSTTSPGCSGTPTSR